MLEFFATSGAPAPFFALGKSIVVGSPLPSFQSCCHRGTVQGPFSLAYHSGFRGDEEWARHRLLPPERTSN